MARRGYDLLGKKERMLGNGARIEWNDRQLSIDIAKNMNTNLKQDAELVAKYAREEVPVGKIKRAASKFKSWAGRKPGKLRDSIKVYKSRYKDGGYIVMVGGYDTYYWFFVEYGTSKMHPRPFMRNALKKTKYRIKGIF